LEDAKRVVDEYVRHYNEERLHGAVGYVTPQDRLEGRDKGIHRRRDQPLQEARERRRHSRAAARDSQHGQGESSAFVDHGNAAPLDRRGSQGEPATSAPCGLSEHSERVMPEVRLTDPTIHGRCGESSNPNQTAPSILEMVAHQSSSQATRAISPPQHLVPPLLQYYLSARGKKSSPTLWRPS